MDINTLIANYTSYDELKIFAEAQFRQIQNLTKKNKDLQEKLERANKPAPIIDTGGILNVSKEDAKVICQIQLNLLRQAAMERELNTDEAKRVELYNRILKEDAVKDNSKDQAVQASSVADLLKLVE